MNCKVEIAKLYFSFRKFVLMTYCQKASDLCEWFVLGYWGKMVIYTGRPVVCFSL